jgi:hypothetical protein
MTPIIFKDQEILPPPYLPVPRNNINTLVGYFKPGNTCEEYESVKEEKVFDALEWLAAMCSHVPNKGEQMVRYYGYYSNVSRGKRQKENQDGLIPYILEPGGSSKEYRKNWARLIQKIYESLSGNSKQIHEFLIQIMDDSVQIGEKSFGIKCVAEKEEKQED